MYNSFQDLLIQTKVQMYGWCGMIFVRGIGLCVFAEKPVLFPVHRKWLI